MTDVPFTGALRGVLVALCATLLIWCQACSVTPMQRARTVISASASAVVAVDRIMAPRYAAVMGAAVVDPEVAQRWNRAVEALLLTRSALLISEATLDAIEEGQEGDIRGTLGCVTAAIMKLIEALPTIDVELPDALVLALNLVGSFAGSCEPTDHVSVLGVPNVSDVVAVTP